jgi:hypothetical protein
MIDARELAQRNKTEIYIKRTETNQRKKKNLGNEILFVCESGGTRKWA